MHGRVLAPRLFKVPVDGCNAPTDEVRTAGCASAVAPCGTAICGGHPDARPAHSRQCAIVRFFRQPSTARAAATTAGAGLQSVLAVLFADAARPAEGAAGRQFPRTRTGEAQIRDCAEYAGGRAGRLHGRLAGLRIGRRFLRAVRHRHCAQAPHGERAHSLRHTAGRGMGADRARSDRRRQTEIPGDDDRTA